MRTVWLPTADAEAVMGGLPDGLRADVWTGGDVPASSDRVEVVCPPFDIEPEALTVLADLPRLRLVQLESVGADWVLPYMPDGVTLCNARGAYDVAVAEWVLATTLAQVRELPAFGAAQRRGDWAERTTGTLAGATVLIVGYGSIGAHVANLVRAFGAEAVGIAAHPRPGVHGPDDLLGLLPQADVVVLLTPGTVRTRGMVDAAFLARLHDGALLINAGRGAVVDTDALVEELYAGRLRACLDVVDPEPLPPDHPLWSAPGVLLTPHVAGSDDRTPGRALALVRRQLERWAAGEPLDNVVGPEGY